MKSYSLPPGDRILNPHSSRSVWSFSSLSKTKGPSRYPTTLGDRVERELLLITKQKGRIHKQREPKGPLAEKTKTLDEMQQKTVFFPSLEFT